MTFGRIRCRALAGALLLAPAACTDALTVDAAYPDVWSQCTRTMVENGFEMVQVADLRETIPASDEAAGRAWFRGGVPDGAGWEAPRLIEIEIDPVVPPEPMRRTVTVRVEQRDWVARAKVPDPALQSRIVWLLRQAFATPVAAPVAAPAEAPAEAPDAAPPANEPSAATDPPPAPEDAAWNPTSG